jgi:type I restriction enzyme S subunit
MMFYKETNFKETPIRRIPMEWEVVRFGEIIEFIKGKKPKQITEEYNEDYLPYLSTEYLRESKITKFVRNLEDVVLVNNGDLILLWDGSNAGEFFLGKRGVLSSTMVKIELKEKRCNQEFLYYLLKTKENYLKGQTRGTGIPHVDGTVLNSLIIPLPFIQEQQKIAEILSTVDEAIQKTSEVIAKTERLKKGLMQELLTKGIGHKEFKDTEIGRIPEEWKVIKLGNAGEFQYGITTSAVREDTGINLLRITDISDGKIKWENIPFCKVTEPEFDRYRLKVGDVLFARIGATTGKTCYINRPIKGVFGSYLIRFISNVDIDRRFLYFYTQSDLYWRQVNSKKEGQLKKGLNTKMLGSLSLPFPPLHEQQRIAKILSSIDKKLEIERNEKAKLERIKQALMDLLLTGKIRVRIEKRPT